MNLQPSRNQPELQLRIRLLHGSSLLHAVLQVKQSCKTCLLLQARQRCLEQHLALPARDPKFGLQQHLSAYITDFSSHLIHFSAMVDISCLLDLVLDVANIMLDLVVVLQLTPLRLLFAAHLCPAKAATCCSCHMMQEQLEAYSSQPPMYFIFIKERFIKKEPFTIK